MKTLEFYRAKNDAASKVAVAVYRGQLVQLSKKFVLCSRCRKKRARCYDHRDYSKPLEVTPVCHSCNRQMGSAIISKKMKNKIVKKTKCLNCGHKWVPRGKKPVMCPQCKSRKYSEEPK